MKYFIAWLRNNTDIRDDEPIKIKAKDKTEATKIVSTYLRNRFSLRGVYTLSEFKKIEPWWHAQFWGKKAVNEGKWIHA